MSSAPTASGSPPPIDPCTLLTNEQASAVNGGTYGDGVEHVLPPSALCVRQSSSNKATLTVEVASARAGHTIAEQFAAFKASLAAYQLEDLTGYGDGAFIGRSDNQGVATGGIYMLKGDHTVFVVYLQGTVPSDAVLETAATIALAELP